MQIKWTCLFNDAHCSDKDIVLGNLFLNIFTKTTSKPSNPLSCYLSHENSKHLEKFISTDENNRGPLVGRGLAELEIRFRP